MHNFFELLNLSPSFALNEAQLKKNFLSLQQQYHPDRFAQHDETEKLKALQHSTLLNDAFSTLKNPISRAQHLLQLFDSQNFLENKAVPEDFLIRQLQWHEELENAQRTHDERALEHLFAIVEQECQQNLKALANAFLHQNYEQAAALLREAMFLDKIKNSIDHALE